MRSLSVGLGFGLVAGIAVATAAITSMYPDVPKRMRRDGRRMARTAKHTIGQIMR